MKVCVENGKWKSKKKHTKKRNVWGEKTRKGSLEEGLGTFPSSSLVLLTVYHISLWFVCPLEDAMMAIFHLHFPLCVKREEKAFAFFLV